MIDRESELIDEDSIVSLRAMKIGFYHSLSSIEKAEKWIDSSISLILISSGDLHWHYVLFGRSLRPPSLSPSLSLRLLLFTS